MARLVELAGGEIAAVYETLFDANENAVEARCDEVGIEFVELRQLARSYADKDLPWNGNHLEVLTWFMVTVGPYLGSSPASFEIEANTRLAPVGGRLVFPMWMPAVPGPNPVEGGRLPAWPLATLDSDVSSAYEGLVMHVAQRNQVAALEQPELALSSVLWRVGALADWLKAHLGEAALYSKLAAIRQELIGSHELSISERDCCTRLDPDFANRRNVLSHLINKHPWSFENAALASVSEAAEIWSAATAVTLAVIRHRVDEMRRAAPPRGQVQAVIRELDW